jgi:hypothetical protein
MTVFWVAAQCNLVKFTYVSEVFAASLIRALTPKTMVNSYQTTQHYNPEDSHLHTCYHKNLIFYFC